MCELRMDSTPKEDDANGAVSDGNANDGREPIPLPSSVDRIINLDHGDPKMFEQYWKQMSQDCEITIGGSQLVSYFSDIKNLCWFLEPSLADAIRSLHKAVGNAVSDGDRFLIVGTGSSQLFQAALFALSYDAAAEDRSHPVSVVSAAPYYSSYPELTDFLRSGLYKWAGDAKAFDRDGLYIEAICYPNNPDGSIRKESSVMMNNNRGTGGEGKLQIHDLAYYWPHYTPITSPADHDIMLFTLSKCTGHAGSRIGWALVKDEAVAKKMIKFLELSTIGTSKDSQLRAAKIIQFLCKTIELKSAGPNFFEYGHSIMIERWRKLHAALQCCNGAFVLPADYQTQYCNFLNKPTKTFPAFAWMECKKREDGAKLMRDHKILTRNGQRFGVDNKYIRVSMIDNDDNFNLFLKRLSAM